MDLLAVRLVLAVIFMSCIVSYVPGSIIPAWDGQDLSRMGSYKSLYARSAEVEDRCASVLGKSLRDPLALVGTGLESKKWEIQNELSFQNGDWQQDDGVAPLMPFITRSELNSSKPGKDPVRLVSLWITDVDLQGRSSRGNAINVSAILQLGISTDRPLSYMGSSFEDFQIYPGFSLVAMSMEGVYAETGEGERILCMLGCSRLPIRGQNVSDPWSWADSVPGDASFLPPVSKDCNVMADFHYPHVLSLTTRAVRGRLSSFHAPSSPGYFNAIDLSTQLGAYSNYEFSPGNLVEAACQKPDQVQGILLPPAEVYKGNRFCAAVMDLLSGQWVDVMPNWKCSLSREVCTKLGPFSTSKPGDVDGGFNGTQLLIQDVRCVDFTDANGVQKANMSATIRAVLPSQNRNLALERTVLNGLSLAVEGTWNNASGQLCMVGCRGSSNVDGITEGSRNGACDSRISIYIPLSLSLKQRSVLLGSISSIHNDTETFYPLSFQLLLHPPQLPWDVLNRMTYTYTKINVAGSILEKDEPIGFGERIKKSLLKYPYLMAGGYKENFMALSEDLSVHSLSITNPGLQEGPHVRQYIDLDVIAIEDYVGVGWLQSSGISPSAAVSVEEEASKKVPDEQKDLLRVAAQLKIQNRDGKPTFSLFVEGEYDPAVGRMYLAGCREVQASWDVFHENAELLEDGLDCMLEMKVEYPPTNARWLMNPTVMLTISSTRPEDDPLFLSKIELETFPILYKRQREEIVSRKNLEGALSILTLSLIVGCIVSELLHVKSHTDSTPYISLLMLGIQAVGYSIPLITGVEALFARMTSDTEDLKSSVLSEGKLTQMIGYMAKLLTLVAFLLTLRICQKVYKSRIRLGTRRPLEPWRVPNDTRVIAICVLIHAFGFVMVLVIHTVRNHERPVYSSAYIDWSGRFHKEHDWERELQEYFGLVQDLFLLPQVVGNHLWEVKGKPLRKLFYTGITVLRLLPHVYDSLRSPVFNPYFADEYQYANPSSDFYSKVGDIAIPLLAIVLAIVIYIQQRWNGLKWVKVLQSGSSRLMRMGSKMYERLPSKTFEAEMVESATELGCSENGHLPIVDEH